MTERLGQAGAANILFVSPVPWRGLRQRHQAFAELLAEAGYTVFYLDPLRTPGLALHRERVSGRLFRLSLTLPFRSARFPAWQRLASDLALRLLTRRRWQTAATTLWLADPGLAHWCRSSWRGIVYDRSDWHGAFPGQSARVWQTYEELIRSRASLVLASSPFLYKQWSGAAGGRNLLVPNAVTASWLTDPLPTKPSVPPLKVVSAGAHFEWTDPDWLARLTDDPRVELHVAGPGRGEAFARLLTRPRVTWHQCLSHQALRDLFDTCHVGVIPFRDLPLIRGVDPIKAYEYRARGLHVWAPRLPGWEPGIPPDRCFSRDDAVEEIVAAALQRPPSGRPDHLPTWRDRLHPVLELLPEVRYA